MRSHAKAVVAVLAMLLLTLALAANPASAEAPTVSIDPPSEVAYTTAKVSGTVDPKDVGTYWSFETSSDGGTTWSGFNYEGYAEAGSGSQAVPSAGPLELTALKPGQEYKVRLVGINFVDPEVISATAFTTLAVAKPTVTLSPVSAITGESAHFEGAVNSSAPDSNEDLSDAAKAAFETTYRFECTPACPNTPEPQTIAADDEPQTVSFDPEGLEPNTTYTVKLVASNKGGEEVAEDSFKTASLASTAVTHLVANLRSTSARVSGFVDPQNEPTTYFFEWGREPDLGDAQSLPASEDAPAGSGGRPVAVGQDLSGLSARTTYYYRLVSDNPTGPTSVGEIRSFTTRPPLPPMGNGVGAWGDRAYELVSTPNRTVPAFAAELSLDGNRAMYGMLGGNDDTNAGGLSTQLMAERTSQGWRSFSPMPTRTKALGVPWIMATDPELTVGLVTYEPPILRAAPQTLARFAFESKELTVGFETPMANSLMRRPYLFGSDDLHHLIVTVGFNGEPPLVTGAAAPSLYDVGSGEAELVSLLPGDASPSCGTTTFLATTNSVATQNQISDDGRRLFFGSRGDDCAGPDSLYLREEGPGGSFAAGTGAGTTLISGPPVAGPLLDAGFVQATPDGSRAFYVTATRLDSLDTDSTPDLYRYTVGAGIDCITCGAPGANLSPEGTLVSEDGSHAYFTTSAALRPGATSGRVNLYRWREGGEISYISDIESLGPVGGVYAVTNPSGSVLAFTARAAGLNGLTGTDNAGLVQRYRYDDRDGSIECLTCPATGSATYANNIPFGSVDRPPVLTDDGRTVVFATGEALLGADVNGGLDIYEWRDGRLGLITGGTGNGQSSVGALALDGRDILFGSKEALLPDAVNGDGQVYDARIGGGFPRVVPPTPCGGDGCQLAPSPAPPSTSAGSAAFSGPGNAKPKKAKPKKRKKAKKNQRKAKQKGKKSRAKNDRRTSR